MANPSEPTAVVARPESRYGKPRRGPSRPVIAVLGVLVVALGLFIAYLGYQRLGTSEVKGELASFELIDDRTVEVTLSVTRQDPSQPVVCIVRGRSLDGSETGRREVLVAPSTDKTVQVSALVKTSRPPVVGDAYGCGSDIPGYLRAPW